MGDWEEGDGRRQPLALGEVTGLGGFKDKTAQDWGTGPAAAWVYV